MKSGIKRVLENLSYQVSPQTIPERGLEYKLLIWLVILRNTSRQRARDTEKEEKATKVMPKVRALFGSTGTLRDCMVSLRLLTAVPILVLG